MRSVVRALFVAGFCSTLVADDVQTQVRKAERVVLQVTALEIDRVRLAEQRPELAAALYLKPELIPAVETDQSLLRQLKQLVRDKGTVNVIAEPSLAAPLGQTAEYRQGGEFEIPIPAQDQRPARIEKKFYGDHIKAKVARRGNQFHVELLFESSRLNQASAVKVNDKLVPGLTRRTFETSVECQPGETLLLTRRLPALLYSPLEGKGEKSPIMLAVFLQVDAMSQEDVSQR